ncbi:MAG: uracil-DNA glycosylase family protein [Bacteroidaceae bacterium]|nr:uracil-DNA glycosylase family protein [Bacteroidaceae bacterium]
MPIEKHPLEPFLPRNARILMLGSFPPPKARWSMEFFYPNWINDMWRIWGLIFYNDKKIFELKGEKRFDKDAIESFCKEKGVALYDTAKEVIRLKENASDKFLEIITPTDITELLNSLPHCRAIVTTGEKATDEIVKKFNCTKPAVGEMTEFTIGNRNIHFWRMPSTSRAYPLPLEKKAEAYMSMLQYEEMLTGDFR